jgi:adenine-specific DNA-methyltransferase
MSQSNSLYYPELLAEEPNSTTEENDDSSQKKEKAKKAIKAAAQVPSPFFLIKTTLDLVGYKGPKILRKHVVDNSCGTGLFLVEIMRRYCEAYLEISQDENQLKEELETYIHGVEIDPKKAYECRINMNNTLREYILLWVKWDIRKKDTTKINDFDGQMDFVVANPPYVRSRYFSVEDTHLSEFRYAQNGNTDLYLIFYEIGLRMLNSTGILGYITPCSVYNSFAASVLREDIVEFNLLSKIVNFEHYQWFSVATYTTIMILDRQHQGDLVEYYRFDEDNHMINLEDRLSYSDIAIDGIMYLGNKEDLKLMKEIIEISKVNRPKLEVKNGIATTNDKFFIQDFGFESEYLIPVLKAASGKMKKLFYPYRKGYLVRYDELIKDENIKKCLNDEITLMHERKDKIIHQWYGFGRSQGLIDISKPKIAINYLIRKFSDLKINFCPPGTAVMTGYYIVGDITVEELRQRLETETFLRYIQTINKYRLSHYYSYSAKELKNYLFYALYLQPLERDNPDAGDEIPEKETEDVRGENE